MIRSSSGSSLITPHSQALKTACNVGDLGSIPGSGRCPAVGNGNPLQYSCLENSMDRGTWWATVHGVAELDTTEQLTHTHTAQGTGGTSLNTPVLTMHPFQLAVPQKCLPHLPPWQSSLLHQDSALKRQFPCETFPN